MPVAVTSDTILILGDDPEIAFGVDAESPLGPMWPGRRFLTVSNMRNSHVPTSKVEAVRRLPAFAACTDKELVALCQEADELDFLPGAQLMREGDRSGEVFLILSGRVSVVHCGAVIASVGSGETVGEMGIIDSGPRSASVMAETPVRALVFGRRQVGGLLDQVGPARAVARILSHRLRRANDAGTPLLSPVA